MNDAPARSPRSSALAVACALGTTVLLSPATFAAAPEGGLEEIVVTATKAGETKLQETPIAITAFSGEDLATRGVNNIRGLIDLTPGLQISDVNGYAQLYLRGVGSNNVFIGSDPSTTIHVDGIYMARPVGYFAEFLDVERIEVLRGPQGTLYGRNSVGGTINVISRRPTEAFSGKVRAAAGNYDKYSLEAYLSGPLGDSGVRGSLSAGGWKRDPWLDNESTGDDIEEQDAHNVRGQLLVPLGERAEVILRADSYRSDEDTAGASKLLEPVGLPLEDSILGDYWKITADAPNHLKVRSDGVSADLSYALSDNFTLKSLTAYRELESIDRTDSDATSLDVTRALFDLDQDQFSQEFNVSGRVGNAEIVTGLYYFTETDKEPADVILPLWGVTHFQRPRLEAESWAAFAQGQYWLNEQWSLIAGVRYSREWKDYEITDFWTASGATDPDIGIQAPPLVGAPGFSDPFSIESSKDYDAWTPRFGVNYEPCEDLLFYASATRGFKSGGFDFGSTGPVDQSTGFDPEYLWSYELGMKSQWLDNRLRANVAAFYYDYEDLQVTLYTPPASAFTQNAATAEVKGLELELQARPVESLDLFLNAAWLDATYDEYTGAQIKAFGPIDASGQRLNNAPQWTWVTGFTWTLFENAGGSYFIGSDLHYQTSQYFSPANDGVRGSMEYLAQQDDMMLVNARVGWHSADDAWEALLVGRNLLEEEYITTAVDYGGPNVTSLVGRPGAPRTVEFQLSRSF